MSAIATGVTMPTAMSLARKAEAGVPRRGGNFRYGVGFAAGGPSATSDHFLTLINFTLGSCLTEVHAGGAVSGALAESFEPADQGRTWTFAMRRGVEFHDAKPLTSNDVVASLEHARARGHLRDVVTIQSDGAGRITVELVKPDPNFPRRIADPSFVVWPAQDGRIDVANGNGTGAYRLDRFQPGEKAFFVRDHNHWRDDRGFFETVELISMPDTALRQSAIMNGDVDFIDRVDPGSVALLKRMPTLEILETEGNGHFGVPLPTGAPPFHLPKLQRALALAIDRQELLDKVLLGHGAVLADDFQESSSPRFDPDAAAHAYRASGHTGPIRLLASDTAFPGALSAARLLAATAARAGIDIEIRNSGHAQGWCARACESQTMDQPKPSPDPGRLRVNDIHAHTANLAHRPQVGANMRADGGKIAERWWFA